MATTQSSPKSPVRIILRLPATPPSPRVKIILRVGPTPMEKTKAKAKAKQKEKEKTGTAKPKGVVKSTKKPPLSIKRSIRELKEIFEAASGYGKKQEIDRGETRKVNLSDLTTGHLEPPFKHLWIEPPAITTWVKPEVIVQLAIPTNIDGLLGSIIPTLPPITNFGSAFPLSAVRDYPVPEKATMASTRQMKVHIKNEEHCTYYFAYGTDLSIIFMEYAYPGIEYVSPATLSNFQWLIGSRNKPIITSSPTEEVNGILYSIPTRYVGILTARTHKHASAVPAFLDVKKYVDKSKTAPYANWGYAPKTPNLPGKCTALVFVAEGPETEGVLEGEAGEKMIKKMNRGIMEAKMQGFDPEWSDRVLRKAIPFRKGFEGAY